MRIKRRMAAMMLTAALAGAAPAAAAGAADPAAFFAENCAVCHGADAGGVEGLGPNLTDGRWIWGGDRTTVRGTIAYGVRNGDAAARDARMPAFGVEGLLYDDEIAAIVAAILSAAGDPGTDAEVAAQGADLYLDHCAMCHGDAMEGGYMPGAPALTGPNWLFGGSAAALSAQIHDPAHGVMPGWRDQLGEAGVAAMADYVLSLRAAP